MPAYSTPEPITAVLTLGVGDCRITASDRDDTVVEIRPGDPNNESDVRAAEATTVEFENGRLRITGKKPKWFSMSKKKTEAVEITLQLPTGSSVRATSAFGDLTLDGTFGATELDTAFGTVRAEETGPLVARTAFGQVDVGHVAGRADISTGSGELRVHRVDGEAVLKNSNGDTQVGRVDGELRVKSANGSIAVDHAGSGVEAKTANGSIRLSRVERGEIVAETSIGTVDVGVKRGVATWIDAHSEVGRVYQELEASGAPAPGEQSVRLRLRSAINDITIRYAADEL